MQAHALAVLRRVPAVVPCRPTTETLPDGGSRPAKSPRLPGWQRHPFTDADQVATHWGIDHPDDLVAVHTGRAGIVVLDLDRHGSKDGFAALAASGQPLPDTFHYVTTSGNGVHHWFRCPAGYSANGATDLGGLEGVDTRSGNSVAVIPPGVTVPDLASLAECPAWIVAANPNRADRAQAAGYSEGVQAWLQRVEQRAGHLPPDGAATGHVAKLRGEEFNNEQLWNTVCALVAIGAEGRNMLPALDLLRAEWLRPPRYDTPELAAVFDDQLRRGIEQYGAEKPGLTGLFAPDRHTPQTVTASALTTSVADAASAPVTVEQPEADPAEDLADDDDVPDELDPGFWDERPELARIRDAARARMVGPWAVLGHVLVNTLMGIPYGVHVPPIIGGPASLNMLAAIVGGSGSGKGGAARLASTLLPLPEGVHPLPPGSGEGLAKAFGAHRTGEDPGFDWANPHHAALFDASEVTGLRRLGERTGATLEDQLLKLFSGEALGFQNAGAATRIVVDAMQYRGCLTVGVQPALAGALLDGLHSGFPQRFIWMPAADPGATDQTAAEERTLLAPLDPYRFPAHQRDDSIHVHDSIQREIRAQHLRTVQRGGGDLDAHSRLTRLKVAAALAVLNRRNRVQVNDWQLAGRVMRVSRQTRQMCADAIAAAALDRAAERGQRQAAEREAATEATARTGMQRTRILEKLASGPPASRNEIRKWFDNRNRPSGLAALDWLVDAGRVIRDGNRFTLPSGEKGRGETPAPVDSALPSNENRMNKPNAERGERESEANRSPLSPLPASGPEPDGPPSCSTCGQTLMLDADARLCHKCRGVASIPNPDRAAGAA